MAKRKAGLPKNLNLLDGTAKPESGKPIRTGDYLDELMTVRERSASVVPVPDPRPNSAALSAVPHEREGSHFEAQRKTVDVKRTRLNVSMDGRKRLSSIVDRMKRYGPEPDVRASEVLEALILALYESQEHLDLGNVRRRGKFGSPSHKNFPVALAESVREAIAAVGASQPR